VKTSRLMHFGTIDLSVGERRRQEIISAFGRFALRQRCFAFGVDSFVAGKADSSVIVIR
jgi:hypothetical protein